MKIKRLISLLLLLPLLSACVNEKQAMCYLDKDNISTNLTLTYKGDHLIRIDELVILDKKLFKDIYDEDYKLYEDDLYYYLSRSESVLNKSKSNHYFSYFKTKEELFKLGFNCIEK